MKTDKVQLLREPEIQPTDDVIANALGEVNDIYVKFLKELESHNIQLEWRYYKDGKSWLAKGLYRWTGARGGQKEVTVLWLSIWEGFFMVTLYVPEKFRAEAYGLPVDDEVKEMLANAKQMGKLKFFPLTFELYTDDVFESLFYLAEFRKGV